MTQSMNVRNFVGMIKEAEAFLIAYPLKPLLVRMLVTYLAIATMLNLGTQPMLNYFGGFLGGVFLLANVSHWTMYPAVVRHLLRVFGVVLIALAVMQTIIWL